MKEVQVVIVGQKNNSINRTDFDYPTTLVLLQTSFIPIEKSRNVILLLLYNQAVFL